MSDFNIEKYLRKPNRRVSRTVTSDTTLQNGDSGGVVIIDSSNNDVEITIPSDANESFADGTVIWLYRDGANLAIVRGESGVTLNPNEGYIQSDKTEIYIRKQAANEWVVGDLGGYQTSIAATGGTVSDITVGGVDYRVHEFTTVGTSTFNVEFGGEVEYLIVAGGGGGGNYGGGGGAGGYRSSVSGEQSGGGTTAEPSFTVSPGTYVVTVGSGGTKGGDSRGTNGEDSSFATVTSLGGGGGGGNAASGVTEHTGRDGGSGGGASQQNANGLIGEGTTGQGFDGGQAASSNVNHRGGGGGGAGEKGFNATPGNGGDGVSSTIDGTATFRAGGGGGGGSAQTNTVGGAGGGGDYNTPGAANTGGGGGSNNNQPAANANGGSGIVIIRYRL